MLRSIWNARSACLCQQIARYKHVVAQNYLKAQRLVPVSGKVCLIEDGKATQGFSLENLKLGPKQDLQILKVSRSTEGEDPEVVVKVVQTEDLRKHTKEKKKSVKPAQVKEIQVSWSISSNDLQGQKRKAIASVLSRGHTAQVTLQNKKRSRKPIGTLELESRQKVADDVAKLLDELGTPKRAPVGSIQSQLVFTYTAKDEAEPSA